MKQAIVLTSFGAMGDDSRKLCLDALEADFRAEFPGAVIVQAFTSKFIRAHSRSAASMSIPLRRHCCASLKRRSRMCSCSRRT